MTTRVERNASSWDERAGMKATTPEAEPRDDGGAGRVGSTAAEVDAVRDPTELFRRISGGDWEGALDVARRKPAEAGVWISRHRDGGEGFAWKYLPLHLICLQQRPPLDLLIALLQIYPPAASLPAPHDGNLPLHYVCESGCEDERVFGALLENYPQSLEVKNFEDKTPLLMCHSKSRGVFTRVLRQRKTLPFNGGQQQGKRNKSRKNTRPGAERRNDIDTTWRETPSKDEHGHPSRHRPPQTVPARYANRRRIDFSNVDGPTGREVAKTPKVFNHRPSSKHETTTRKLRREAKRRPKSELKQELEQEPEQEPKRELASFFTSPSSSGDDAAAAASYISSKTTELALSALNYVYPSYEQYLGQGEPAPQQEGRAQAALQKQVHHLAKESTDGQHTIKEPTRNLDQLNPSNAASIEDSKLCERILAKAEADNVSFRTQIQKLQDDKEEMKREAELKEKANQEFLDRMRKVIYQKGLEMKIDPFGDESARRLRGSEGNDQIVEALGTVLSHMDKRNDSLHSTIAKLQEDLSKSEVAFKTMQSKNRVLQGERDSMVEKQRELERTSAILVEEKGLAQTRLSNLQHRLSTLTVINQSLQNQVDSLSNSQANKENEKCQSELNSLKAQLVQMKEVETSAVQMQSSTQAAEREAAEREEKIESLLERNRSLKDTILSNNEKYSKKVHELGEKYSAIEKANEDLRQRLARRSCNDGTQTDVKVHLKGEKRLLYEV